MNHNSMNHGLASLLNQVEVLAEMKAQEIVAYQQGRYDESAYLHSKYQMHLMNVSKEIEQGMTVYSIYGTQVPHDIYMQALAGLQHSKSASVTPNMYIPKDGFLEPAKGGGWLLPEGSYPLNLDDFVTPTPKKEMEELPVTTIDDFSEEREV